jgi:hypothetical protein
MIVLLGILIFRYLFDLSWLDSWYVTALCVSTTELAVSVITPTQKIVVSFYTLTVTIIFIAIISYIANRVISWLDGGTS